MQLPVTIDLFELSVRVYYCRVQQQGHCYTYYFFQKPTENTICPAIIGTDGNWLNRISYLRVEKQQTLIA